MHTSDENNAEIIHDLESVVSEAVSSMEAAYKESKFRRRRRMFRRMFWKSAREVSQRRIDDVFRF